MITKLDIFTSLVECSQMLERLAQVLSRNEKNRNNPLVQECQEVTKRATHLLSQKKELRSMQRKYKKLTRIGERNVDGFHLYISYRMRTSQNTFGKINNEWKSILSFEQRQEMKKIALTHKSHHFDESNEEMVGQIHALFCNHFKKIRRSSGEPVYCPKENIYSDSDGEFSCAMIKPIDTSDEE